MYSDNNRFTELEKKFIKAFEEFNIELLQECLDEGMDINANPSNYFLPSLLAESLEFLDEDFDSERYENWAYGDIDVKSPIIETDRIKFIKFCIEKGINLNAKEDDCGEIIYLAFDVARYCYDYNVVKFKLSQNINLNVMVKDSVSILDFAGEHIFCDGYGSRGAMCSYYQERLLTYYGAKPAAMLEAQLSENEKLLHQALFSLDINRIKELLPEDILKYKLDSVLIEWARYYYPEQWYCETEEFEKRMIPVYKEIIAKIGIENLSSNVLYECVCQKLPLLLEFLLKEGANPNVNCFNDSYKWVKSSSLYELYLEGNYFSKDLYLRMKKALLEAGANLDGKQPLINFGEGYIRWIEEINFLLLFR